MVQRWAQIFKVALLISLTAVAPARQATTRDLLDLLRRDDTRLASVGQRLAVGNAALCREKRSWVGLVVHTLDQYQPTIRADAIALFAFPTPVAVEAVLPDEAAANVGIVANDGIVAVGDHAPLMSPPQPANPASTQRRDAAERAIAALTPDVPARFVIRHGGTDRPVLLTPRAGCQARFEVHEIDEAAADGSIVQIGASYMDAFGAQWLPVIVAHELAHLILKHRARMDAAGVKYGIFSELGRSGRLHAQAETEADRLSVYLLFNAGYDPHLAGAFWRGPGKKLDGGLFRNRAYPGWRDRAAALDAEAANIPAGAHAPFVPPMIALADQQMR
jgi:hypothetical protein